GRLHERAARGYRAGQHKRDQLSPCRVDGRGVAGRTRTNDDDVTYVAHLRAPPWMPTAQQILGRGDSPDQPASSTDVMTCCLAAVEPIPPTHTRLAVTMTYAGVPW